MQRQGLIYGYRMNRVLGFTVKAAAKRAWRQRHLSRKLVAAYWEYRAAK